MSIVLPLFISSFIRSPVITFASTPIPTARIIPAIPGIVSVKLFENGKKPVIAQNVPATCPIRPIAVIIIGLAVFAGNGLYPFGDKTLAWCDMHQQVLPLLLDFKDILEGKGDFLFNWQNAGGMNFLGVFLFFISSPFSLLVVFVDKADMMLFMNIMTLMKMAVCAITANVYFRTCHKKLDVVYSALFSVMYAFSGYSMLFYQNTVWLDVMYFFPLLLIAFNSLIKRKRIGGLIFCLVGMLVLNYYLSYMIVLFTILFFGVYLFFNRKKGSAKGIAPRFILGCAIAALISAVVWLPSFVQYLSSARGANYSGYSNAEVDEALTKARESSDPAVRKQYYDEFQVALANDPAYAFICYIDANYVATSRLHGIDAETVMGHHGVGIFWNVETWTLN